MKITGNEPATPQWDMTFEKNPGTDLFSAGTSTGMTIRQQFAMNANPDLEGYSMNYMESIVGRERPDSNEKLAVIKFLADFKAILQVIAADSLIAALNKNE